MYNLIGLPAENLTPDATTKPRLEDIYLEISVRFFAAGIFCRRGDVRHLASGCHRFSSSGVRRKYWVR